MGDMKRLTIDVGSKIDARLTALAETKQTSKAEVIRNAIATYAYLDKEVNGPEGHRVAVADADGKVVKEVILP